MSSMTMSPSMSMTAAAASASSSAASMSGMDMGNSCKIAMTWNWYTVGACFISKSWQITSSGMFAGSCIGVICLVISLEFLRRVQREYDGHVRRQDQRAFAAACASDPTRTDSSPSPSTLQNDNPGGKQQGIVNTTRLLGLSSSVRRSPVKRTALLRRQFIRALIHMLQFGVAYFVMLLAMYYNGYIIICIMIGAFLGAFIFSWDQLLNEVSRRPEAADVTGCCG